MKEKVQMKPTLAKISVYLSNFEIQHVALFWSNIHLWNKILNAVNATLKQDNFKKKTLVFEHKTQNIQNNL